MWNPHLPTFLSNPDLHTFALACPAPSRAIFLLLCPPCPLEKKLPRSSLLGPPPSPLLSRVLSCLPLLLCSRLNIWQCVAVWPNFENQYFLASAQITVMMSDHALTACSSIPSNILSTFLALFATNILHTVSQQNETKVLSVKSTYYASKTICIFLTYYTDFAQLFCKRSVFLEQMIWFNRSVYQ